MSRLEVTAVERFAHALAEPLAPAGGAPLPDKERTAAMTHAVDEVIERFAARAGDDEKSRARHLAIVEGLIAMMSHGIGDYAALCRQVESPTLAEAMAEAHDAMVDDYYRLLSLRADLDPDAKAGGPALGTSEELKNWFDQVLS